MIATEKRATISAAGWKTSALREVCSFSNGLWTGKKGPFQNVSVIRNTNFTKDGRLDTSNIARIEVESKQFSSRKLKIGDIVLEKSGGGPKQPVGRVAYFDIQNGEYSFSNFTSAIRVIDPKAIDSRFLHYFLHWFYVSGKTENMQSHSTGIRNLNNDAYKSIEFSYPLLGEQRRIVRVLDEAFEAIADAKSNTEKNLENAKAVFEIELNRLISQESLGRMYRKLEDVCSIESVLIDPRRSEFQDLVHVGAGNIGVGSGVLSNLQTAKEEGLISGKFIFDESMVLYSKIRPYLMKVARPDFAGLCSADIYPLHPNSEQITRDYLYYLLLSKNFTDYAILGSARAGMPKVNRDHLFQYQAKFPNKGEQQLITEKLDSLKVKTQQLEQNYHRKLAALEELKQSLLNKAFSGEL